MDYQIQNIKGENYRVAMRNEVQKQSKCTTYKNTKKWQTVHTTCTLLITKAKQSYYKTAHMYKSKTEY